MINLITEQSKRKNADGILYRMDFDCKAACDKYNVNTHSFKIEFDDESTSLKLTSLTDIMNDQGFTVDNRDSVEAHPIREQLVDTIKKARFVVITYRNASDHKFMSLRLHTGDTSIELVRGEAGEGFYSVIIPTPRGAYFRDYVTSTPSNISMYPFWEPPFSGGCFKTGDTLYIKHFTYFTDEDSAYAYCDSLLEDREICGYYPMEKLDLDMLELVGDGLSEASKEYIRNAAKGILPSAPERRAPKNGKMMKKVPDGLVEELDGRFEERKNAILAAKSEWTLRDGGKIVYVSTSGDDNNDGLSPESPKRTIACLDGGLLAPGDVVLLKRGDVWHEKLILVPYVSYSAYGEGKKPELRGSYNGVGKEKWIECERHGLYRFAEPIPPEKDVGNIVFGEGEYYGSRVLKDMSLKDRKNVRVRSGDDGLTSNGKEYWYNETEPMEGAEILRNRFEYYHEHESSTLYLYSPDGNPGELYDMLEISTYGNVVSGNASGVTVDNLCIRFTGSHGVGTGTCKNFTVRNCEVGWIGGSLQNVSTLGNCRYGNAIEIFGGCDNYKVYNNYVYQCFDCGPTVQWQGTLGDGRVLIENDIEIYGNAIEKCNSPLEVWCTTKSCDLSRFAVLSNITLYDNLCRGSGWGFGGYTHQKSDYNMFYGGVETRAVYENAYMEDNFMWNIRKYVQKATPTHSANTMGFNWRNNTIIKDLGSPLALLGEDAARAKGNMKVYYYDEETLSELYEIGAFGDNTFYYTNAKAPGTKR